MKFALIETANIYTDAAAAAAAVTATIIVFAIFKHVFPLCFGSLVGFCFLSLATKDSVILFICDCRSAYLPLPKVSHGNNQIETPNKIAKTNV